VLDSSRNRAVCHAAMRDGAWTDAAAVVYHLAMVCLAPRAWKCQVMRSAVRLLASSSRGAAKYTTGCVRVRAVVDVPLLPHRHPCC
jgi:hypothetical protein